MKSREENIDFSCNHTIRQAPLQTVTETASN